MKFINMKLQKKGLIFKPKGNKPWSLSHAQVPFAFKLNEDVIRVFYATRDANSCTSTSFVDLSYNDPSQVLKEYDKYSISKGEKGSYDDSGVMPSWVIKDGKKLRLYYTGWNKSEEASYRLSIGIAESNDCGLSFHKLFKGPILDRSIHDPIWVGQPCVLKEGNNWKMWYLSCEKIEIINDHPEPFYNVKYASSKDGISWERKNIICIDFEDEITDAIGRPCVWKYKGYYFMLHSNRKAHGYRTQIESSYSINLSKSKDGFNWRNIDAFRMQKTGDDTWDGMMNEYCSVLETKRHGVFYVFYNGNGFGASGFGYFILDLNE